MTKKWKTYEEVATYLLDKFAADFGLARFEGKQKVEGKRSQTAWEIDAKGIDKNNEIFLVVECRRNTTSRQKQGDLARLAYSIIDAGAAGGIIVSPLELQKGAKKITKAENIITVTLDKDSTPTEFRLFFLDKLRVGKQLQGNIGPSGTLSAKVIRKDGTEKDLGKLNTR